jgi:hypothetical protein
MLPSSVRFQAGFFVLFMFSIAQNVQNFLGGRWALASPRQTPRLEWLMARDGKKVIQFLERGKYFAVVADGKVHLYPAKS